MQVDDTAVVYDNTDDVAATAIPLYANCPGRSYIDVGATTGNVARIQTYQLEHDSEDEYSGEAGEAPADVPGTTTTTPPHMEVGSYPKSAECEWLIKGERS